MFSIIKFDSIEIAKWIIVFLAVLLVVILGFSIYSTVDNYNNRMSEGIIVKKIVDDEFTSVQMVGKTPISIYHPKSYSFVITNNVKTYLTSVSEEDFNRYKIKDHYVVKGGN